MPLLGLPPSTAPAALHPVQLEWTPELHAKFVEAVEGLPADKQVPSRILEHMGDWGAGLTRANIASHLQKYRNRRAAAEGAGERGGEALL